MMLPISTNVAAAAAMAASRHNAAASQLVALPDDIIVSVLFTLPIPDMLRFASTCRGIHKLTLDAEFWRQLTLRAGLDVDHGHHAVEDSGKDNQPAPSALVPNTVEAYRSKLIDAIRTRAPAYNSFQGAWMGGDSPHISPRPDAEAIHGQALGVNVWWLDIATSFLIANGTWYLVLHSKASHYANLDNVQWVVESTPTFPPHSSMQQKQSEPAHTWKMTLSSDMLPSNDQYAWTLFSSSSPPHLAESSDYPLLLRSDSPHDLAAQPPPSCALKVYSPTGFSHVRVNLRDTNTQQLKYGWMLDEVTWVRAERWKQFVHQEVKHEDAPGMAAARAVGAVADTVAGVFKRVLGA